MTSWFRRQDRHDPVSRATGSKTSPLEHQVEGGNYIESTLHFGGNNAVKLFTRRNDLYPSLTGKFGYRSSGIFRRNIELANLRDGR
jgi:hypothetical protein